MGRSVGRCYGRAAGIGIMALGAITRQPSLPLLIVPVGLNYFSGHRFRSRVFVDIGDPITVHPSLLATFTDGGEAGFIGRLAADYQLDYSCARCRGAAC